MPTETKVKAIIPASRIAKAHAVVDAHLAQIKLIEAQALGLKKAISDFEAAHTDADAMQEEWLRFKISYRLDKYLSNVDQFVNTLNNL